MTLKKGYITRQAKRLSTGEINRRRFVMQALSAGVTMPTALSLASHAEAAQSRKGGVLRQAVANARQGASVLTGNTLMKLGPDGQLTGELATAIDQTNDGWIVTLRDGVVFHDGTPLTSEDVATAFRGFRQVFERHVLSRSIADISVSQSQVQFHLRRPLPDFAHHLADTRLMIRPLSNPYLGTGPYRLTSDPSERGRYTRNAEYWKPGTCYFDAVELVTMTDAKARQNAILNGEVDVACDLDPRSVALVRQMPGLRFIEGTDETAIGLRISEDWTDNVHLRTALSLLLPRQALVDKVLLGHGRASKGHQNLAKAQSHFARSGVAGPVYLASDNTRFSRATDTAQLIAAEARKIGIDLRLFDQANGAHACVTHLYDHDACIAAMHARSLTAVTDTLAGPGLLESDPRALAERCWFA